MIKLKKILTADECESIKKHRNADLPDKRLMHLYVSDLNSICAVLLAFNPELEKPEPLKYSSFAWNILIDRYLKKEENEKR
jgi:hypothetical protein